MNGISKFIFKTEPNSSRPKIISIPPCDCSISQEHSLPVDLIDSLQSVFQNILLLLFYYAKFTNVTLPITFVPRAEKMNGENEPVHNSSRTVIVRYLVSRSSASRLGEMSLPSGDLAFLSAAERNSRLSYRPIKWNDKRVTFSLFVVLVTCVT